MLPQTYFNSIKVRLEHSPDGSRLKHLGYFNSIKVRLELKHEIRPTSYCGFQFHKGTIRTK